MRVLITAPSLDETRNVSGISTIVRQIIGHGTSTFVHFVAGREDGEKAGAMWLLNQALLPIRFFLTIRRQKIDVVHVNTALTNLSIWRDAALSFAAKFAARPLVLAIHGGKFLMNEFTSSMLARVTTGMMGRADIIIVYSETERKEVLRQWKGLDVRVLPNAIPFNDVPEVSRQNDPPVVIFFGRMHESKGLHEIIEACQKLKKEGVEFVFRAYGEGPLRKFFVKEMRNALNDSFEYGGIVSGKEKWKKLAAADIFVLPSRYGEGLPMAMLEAMAVGCVVVASDIASVTSVVKNGWNGYIVEPQNPGQLVETLECLLENRDGWKSVQDGAISTIRDNFGIDEYIQNLENIYADAAKLDK